MSREEQGSHLGPVVKFREDSFLNNSKLPITMLEDVLRVELCQVRTFSMQFHAAYIDNACMT